LLLPLVFTENGSPSKKLYCSEWRDPPVGLPIRTLQQGHSRPDLPPPYLLQVYPFVRQLRLWIKKNKRRGEKAPRAPRQRSRRPGTPQPPGGGGAPPAVAQGAVQPMTTHVVAQPVPGQSWTQFRFKQDEIVKHLLVG